MKKTRYILTITFLTCLQTFCISQASNRDSIICGIPGYTHSSFPGGNDSLFAFISSNFNKLIPDTCKHGKVYVRFTIDTSGFVKDIKILRGLCKPLDDEAIRLISIMPRWIPAREYIDNKSKPIETHWNLPLKFSMK